LFHQIVYFYDTLVKEFSKIPRELQMKKTPTKPFLKENFPPMRAAAEGAKAQERAPPGLGSPQQLRAAR